MNSFIPLWCKNRLLKQKRLKNCIILISLIVACCVCALVFSQSMMEGITNKYIYLSTGHVNVKGLAAEEIQGFENYISSSDTVVSGNALVYSNENTVPLNIKGVDFNYFSDKRSKELNMELITDDSNLSGLILSKETANQLNVGLGDKIALLVLPDSKQGIIRPVIARVSGLFSTGYNSLDSLFCYTDLDYAYLLFPNKDSISSEVILNDSKLSLEFANLVSDKYMVQSDTWDTLNASVYRNFVSSRQTIFIILVIVVILAAFYVSSVAKQLLNDDINDISLIRLLGADSKLLFKAELLTSYCVTLISIVLGFILGMILSLVFNPLMKTLSKLSISTLSYYLLDFRIMIPIAPIGLILLILAGISFITLLIELRKTKTISPVQLFTQL